MAELFPSGQVTIASGAKYEKSDVQTVRTRFNRWWKSLVECKCTQAKSFSITRDLWELVSNRVYERDAEMRPVLAIRFYGPSKASVDATPVLLDLVAVDCSDYLELLNELDTLRKRVEEE